MMIMTKIQQEHSQRTLDAGQRTLIIVVDIDVDVDVEDDVDDIGSNLGSQQTLDAGQIIIIIIAIVLIW